MIKLMASAESISDQSRDPDLHSSLSRSLPSLSRREAGSTESSGIFIAFSPEGIIERSKKRREKKKAKGKKMKRRKSAYGKARGKSSAREERGGGKDPPAVQVIA